MKFLVREVKFLELANPLLDSYKHICGSVQRRIAVDCTNVPDTLKIFAPTTAAQWAVDSETRANTAGGALLAKERRTPVKY